MSLDHFLVLALLAMGICVIAYLAHAESDRRIGELVRRACGDKAKAYALITQLNVQNAQVDSMMRRGARALTDAELDELLKPRVRPIEPHEFRVVERGQPTHFEDDHGPRNAA